MFIFQTNDKSVTIEVSRRCSFVHLSPSPVASEVSLFGIPCRAGVLASTAIEEWTTVWSYVICMCDGNHRFLILTYKNSLCIQTLQFSMMCHICFLLVLFLFFLESYDTFNLNIKYPKVKFYFNNIPWRAIRHRPFVFFPGQHTTLWRTS